MYRTPTTRAGPNSQLTNCDSDSESFGVRDWNFLFAAVLQSQLAGTADVSDSARAEHFAASLLEKKLDALIDLPEQLAVQ